MGYKYRVYIEHTKYLFIFCFSELSRTPVTFRTARLWLAS